MKLKPIPLLLVTFVFSSCGIIGNDSGKTGIVGEWNWIESTHGWTGDIISPDSAGYSQQVIYRSDHTFSLFRADTLVRSGIYSLETDEHKTTIKYEIENDNLYPEQQLEYLKEDVIKLINLCIDCGTSTYKRMK